MPKRPVTMVRNADRSRCAGMTGHDAEIGGHDAPKYARGAVRKTLLVSSSGSAVLDGAAARALIGAKFIPYSEAGAAIPVTTLMPMNIKASAHCRGLRPLDC